MVSTVHTLTVPNSVVEKVINKYNLSFKDTKQPSDGVFTVVDANTLTAVVGGKTITVNCLQSFSNYGTVLTDFKNTGTDTFELNAILGRDTMINTGGTFDTIVDESIVSTEKLQQSPVDIEVNAKTSAEIAAAYVPPPAPAPVG